MDSYSESKKKDGEFKDKLKRNKVNIAFWAGCLTLTLFVYHVFSDGDFSFLLTLGGLFRLFAFGCLLWKTYSQKSMSGVSLKTLELYCAVFVMRLLSITRYEGYLPYDRSGDWVYQAVEFGALVLVAGCVFFLRGPLKPTYDRDQDAFGNLHVPSEWGGLYLALPCLLLGMVFHPNLNNEWFADVCWTVASYLEAVAILPQLFMFQKRGGGTVEPFVSHFVFGLGFARFLHLWFWLSSHHELNDEKYFSGAYAGWFIVGSQLVHMAIMADFFYYYLISAKRGTPMMLPTHGGIV